MKLVCNTILYPCHVTLCPPRERDVLTPPRQPSRSCGLLHCHPARNTWRRNWSVADLFLLLPSHPFPPLPWFTPFTQFSYVSSFFILFLLSSSIHFFFLPFLLLFPYSSIPTFLPSFSSLFPSPSVYPSHISPIILILIFILIRVLPPPQTTYLLHCGPAVSGTRPYCFGRLKFINTRHPCAKSVPQ